MSAIDAAKLYQIIGEKIRKQRDAGTFISQADLADALGIERTSITNIERGTQRAPLNLLYEICAKLEIPIADLLPTILEVSKSTSTGSEVLVGDKSVSVSPKTAQVIERLKKRA